MFILGQGTNGEKQLSVYNNDTVNDILDSVSGYASCRDDLQPALVSSHIRTLSYPNGSLQGVEYSDDNMVYISGGDAGDTPKVSKHNWAFTQSQEVSLDLSGAQIETEGLQLKGSNVHVGIEMHTGNGGHLIYSFPKADFTF